MAQFQLNKIMPQLDGSIDPQAEFLYDNYLLALNRYEFAQKYALNKIVLEAGCGAGYGAEIIAKKAKKVYAIDNSAEAIKSAKKYQMPNLEFHKGNITKLNFRDNYFDVVVAFEVIEHIKVYSKAVSELYRVLKKGGVLILSTPNKEIYSPGTNRPFYPFHFKEFTLKELKDALSQFKKIEIKGQFIKGKNSLIYKSWDPRRIIRIIYSNLPIWFKIKIMNCYLSGTNWMAYRKIIKPSLTKRSDIYVSNDTIKTRTFICIAQKT